ncbi:MAG: AAHS family 4-hydroxybenzoate transporter-like MFS transporter, partial [Planctomycetota bacterium]
MTEKYIHEGSMTRIQVLVIGLCSMINILDGFDVMAIAFTAPQIASEWGLTPETLGIVFSAGFLGMALGAIFLAPLSDRFGRRRLVLSCMLLVIVSMLLTATADSPGTLIPYRFLTGLAIGSMLPSLTSMTSEFSSDSNKNFNISIVQSTYAVGATLGGFITGLLIEDYGWRFIFIAGAVLNTITFVIIIFTLPESLEFLLNKRPRNGLAKANKIITRLGGKVLQEWPAIADSITQSSSGIKGLMENGMRKWTLLLWLTSFTSLFGVYFLMSWIPKIIFDAGFPLEKAIWVGVCINFGGLLGILWLGYQSGEKGLRPMIVSFLAIAGVLMMLFGSLDAGILVLMASAAALGFFSQGGFIGLYSVAARLYPTQIRATGVGWCIGIGRFGAIIGPAIGGVFIGLQWQQSTYFIVLAIPFLIGACSMFFLKAP